MVTFQNNPCTSTVEMWAPHTSHKSILNVINTLTNYSCGRNGIARNGTCVTQTECGDRGGQIAGNCAAGWENDAIINISQFLARLLENMIGLVKKTLLSAHEIIPCSQIWGLLRLLPECHGHHHHPKLHLHPKQRLPLPAEQSKQRSVHRGQMQRW